MTDKEYLKQRIKSKESYNTQIYSIKVYQDMEKQRKQDEKVKSAKNIIKIFKLLNN